MKRIDKAHQDWRRTNTLMKLPGVKQHPGGQKLTIMNNFCPVHYHIELKGCVYNKFGQKDCIKCWNVQMEEEDIIENKQ